MSAAPDSEHAEAIRNIVREAFAGGDQPEPAVARVTEDGAWVGVELGGDMLPRSGLKTAYEAIARGLPDVGVEVRQAGRIFRGGDGWGEGRYVVAVAGGKGGVGKSTTAVNLALTLAAMGERVGLLDCDINAPDVPHMLGMQVTRATAQATLRPMNERVVSPARRRRPHERYGVEMMSVGMEIPERLPPRVTSRLQVSTLLRNLVFEVNWSARILILDAPPGTGEELQTIAGELPLSGALLVTTPQDLAQMDAERTLTLLAEHHVPVAGMVKNMASLTCPHCSRDIDMYASSARLKDAGVPIIGAIPFDVVLSSAADRGVPLVLSDPRGPIAYEFARIGAYVRRWISERANVTA